MQSLQGWMFSNSDGEVDSDVPSSMSIMISEQIKKDVLAQTKKMQDSLRIELISQLQAYIEKTFHMELESIHHDLGSLRSDITANKRSSPTSNAPVDVCASHESLDVSGPQLDNIRHRLTELESALCATKVAPTPTAPPASTLASHESLDVSGLQLDDIRHRLTEVERSLNILCATKFASAPIAPPASTTEASSVPNAVLKGMLDPLYSKHCGLEKRVNLLETRLDEKHRLSPVQRGSDNLSRESSATTVTTANDALDKSKVNVNRSELPRALTMRGLDRRSHNYVIQESMWDSVIFIGFPCIGISGTLLIGIGLLVTIATEVLFILIVYANYSENPFNDFMLDGILTWRAVVAHDIENSDQDQRSLAARVCASVSELSISGQQATQYKDFVDFSSSPIDQLRDLNGQFLCNMALVLWFFHILTDMKGNYWFTITVLQQPRGAASIEEDGDKIRVASIAGIQIFLVLFLVCLPRLLISFFLGIVGVLFLGYTTNVSDLLLNAMALVFVLEIDELLFHALTPTRVKHLISLLEPLPKPAFSSGTYVDSIIHGGYHSFSFRMLYTIIALVLSNILVIHPFNDRMDIAMTYLCGGNKDFFFSINKVTGLVVYSASEPYVQDNPYVMKYAKRAVLDLIGLDYEVYTRGRFKIRRENLTMAIQKDRPEIMALQQGDRAYAATTVSCIDHMSLRQVAEAYDDPEVRKYYLSASRTYFSDTAIHVRNCSELNFSTFCLSPVVITPRALCARHCGCDNPWSGQFYSSGEYGCPTTCSVRWYLNAYYLVPPAIRKFTDNCEDVDKEVLKHELSWQRYCHGLSHFLKTMKSRQSGAPADQLVTWLMNGGCSFITTIRDATAMDFCDPDQGYRSARLWCPRTCTCSISDMKECPRFCAALQKWKYVMNRGCPLATRVVDALECKAAATQVMPENLTWTFQVLNSSGPRFPAGCWVNLIEWKKVAIAYWSDIEDDSIEIAGFTVALCRQPQPMLLDEQSKGNMTRAMKGAQCILDGGVFNAGKCIGRVLGRANRFTIMPSS